MEGVWHQVTQGGLCMDGRMDEGEAERLFPDPGVWKVSPSDAHPVSPTQPRLVAWGSHSLLILSPQEPFPALWGDTVP